LGYSVERARERSENPRGRERERKEEGTCNLPVLTLWGAG